MTLVISIHAPRTGSDVFTAHTREGYIISIHAPRTGSDTSKCLLASPASDFNPRSPHGERRRGCGCNCLLGLFQSTLPARGATGYALVP